jgi:hypothetical protein
LGHVAAFVSICAWNVADETTKAGLLLSTKDA